MCSVATREAAQAAAAPARMRCALPECGGARLRARLPLRLTGWFVVTAVVLSLMVFVSAPIRMRCRPTRAVAGAVFVSYLFAVFAVYSAHSFRHLRMRLNVALACASFFLLARSLSCSERARLL
jgi:hypothetical protein